MLAFVHLRKLCKFVNISALLNGGYPYDFIATSTTASRLRRLFICMILAGGLPRKYFARGSEHDAKI